MLRPRSCPDCNRSTGVSNTRRPSRCSACRLARLPDPVDTRPCTQCSIPIRATSIYIRCEVCRQATRLNAPLNGSRPLDLRSCWQCHNLFAPRTGVGRCFKCRSRMKNIVQPATDLSLLATSSFNPSLNSFQPPNTRKRQVQQDRTFSIPLQPTTNYDPLEYALHGALDLLLREHHFRL